MIVGYLITLTAIIATVCCQTYSLGNSSIASSETISRSVSVKTSTPTGELFLTMDATANGVGYCINASLGTPPQPNNLRIDIIQPYLWVLNSYNFSACDPSLSLESEPTASSYSPEPTRTCVDNGTYNSTLSGTSFTWRESWNRAVFLDYIIVNGSVLNDNFVLENVGQGDDTFDFYMYADFLNANDSNVQMGALGLAGHDERDRNDRYKMFFLDNLLQTGYINSSSYSWYPQNSDQLKLTFGGVNQSQYVEPLVNFDTIPYMNESDGSLWYNYPIVPLSSIAVKNYAQDSSALITGDNGIIPVVLDSRSSTSRLPYDVVINLAIQLNAIYSSSNRIWYVACDVGKLDATVSFNFGNLTVQVPISEFVYNLSSSTDDTVFENGQAACWLSVEPNSYSGYSILGMNFLRHVYFAIDHDGSQIAMAQANNDILQSYFETHKTSTSSNPTKTRIITLTTTNENNSEEILTIYTDIISQSNSKITSTNIPHESSKIKPGQIPFVTPSNITESLTFSYKDEFHSSVAIPPDISGVYSSGTIYTRRRTNSTSINGSSASGFAYKNSQVGDWFGLSIFGIISIIGLGLL